MENMSKAHSIKSINIILC